MFDWKIIVQIDSTTTFFTTTTKSCLVPYFYQEHEVGGKLSQVVYKKCKQYLLSQIFLVVPCFHFFTLRVLCNVTRIINRVP